MRALLTLIFLCHAAEAQSINPADVINWQAMGAKTNAEGSISVFLRLTTKENFSLYREKVTFKYPLVFTMSKKSEAPLTSIVDPLSGEIVETYTSGEFELVFKSSERLASLPLSVTYIACTDKICLFPYTEELTFSLPADYALAGTQSTTSKAGDNETLEQRLINYTGQNTSSFLWLILLAFIGGLLTNFTPVFCR